MANYTEVSDLPKGLMLCNYSINQGAVTVESINAFLDHSNYPIFPYSLTNGFSEDFPYEQFDFIIIHYSIIPTLPGYLPDTIADRLRKFEGPIFQFIQDDYRRVSLMRDFIKRVGVDAVYSIMPLETAKKLYGGIKPNLKIHSYLAGYASSWLNMEKTVPLSRRKTAVGYRGREYPYWFGEITTLKIDLAKRLKKQLKKKWIKTDFSVRERDRIYGRDWVKFLIRCRAIYGTESEVNYLDPHGAMANWYNTLEQLNKHPSSGKKWDGRKVVDTDFFKRNTQPAPGSMSIIPPRVFEVICLRSANVLMEGNYSNVLEPWRHYIPLKKDLSNLDEVVKALKNDALISEMIATTFAEIATNEKYMWQGFGTFVDQTFEKQLKKIKLKPSTQLLTCSQLAKISGHFPYIPNPHTITVANPKNIGIKYAIKRFLRKKWRSLLNLFRSIIHP